MTTLLTRYEKYAKIASRAGDLSYRVVFDPYAHTMRITRDEKMAQTTMTEHEHVTEQEYREQISILLDKCGPNPVIFESYATTGRCYCAECTRSTREWKDGRWMYMCRDGTTGRKKYHKQGPRRCPAFTSDLII